MPNKKARGPDLEKYTEGRNHHYMTYLEGAKYLSLPYWTFVNLAKEAGATWSLRKMAIVDIPVLEKYLEDFLNLKLIEVEEEHEESEKEKMHKRKEIENIEELMVGGHKKYVRYDEGASLYSMGLHTFQKYAKDAGACYKVGNIVLVNTEIFEEFLEAFKADTN